MPFTLGQEILTEDQIEDAGLELARMVRGAETGEQWADIAWLESEIIEAKRRWAIDNCGFGVGA